MKFYIEAIFTSGVHIELLIGPKQLAIAGQVVLQINQNFIHELIDDMDRHNYTITFSFLRIKNTVWGIEAYRSILHALIMSGTAQLDNK